MRADVWDGFVFVSLVAVAARRSPISSAACRRSSARGGWADLRRAHQIVYDVAANWKLVVQNYNECLHCPTLHPALNKLSHYLSGENEPFRRTTWAAAWI